METELLIFLTSVAGLITAIIVGAVMIWREIKGIHVLINSRMDDLLEATRKTAHAAGVEEGKDRPSSRE